MRYELCIIGGAGHVGLPLGVAFANAGVKTVLCDINHAALATIAAGRFPFREVDGHRELRRALRRGTLATTSSPEVISRSRFIVLVIGTPSDEYLNPDVYGITRTIGGYLPYFRDGQILILRSTIYPGTSERIQRYFHTQGRRVRVAFCPERIVQGRALKEIRAIPQIVSAFDPLTVRHVSGLFRRVVRSRIIPLRPIEAELAKLFSNSWRYIKFAVGNQFYMIAHDHHLDYHRIYEAMREDYPRNKDLPGPGFAAGPCLLKDTMQLAAFHSNNFFLGHAAMLVNEGLPNFVIKTLAQGPTPPRDAARPVATLASARLLGRIRATFPPDLKTKTIGILGMAFKGDSDDPRDSLAFKLRKVAAAEAKAVLATDVYIKDPSFVPLSTVLAESDIIILAAPHREYRAIDPRKYPGKQFVDIWGFWKRA